MVKHGQKKKKLRKALLHNINRSEDKTERNLNEVIEKLISGISLLRLKFRLFCRFILQYKKGLLAIKDLPEQMKISYILSVFSSSYIISVFNSNLILRSVSRKRFYKIEPSRCHQT